MTTPHFSREALADIAAFLPVFAAPGFDFGTWVMRQGSFPFVAYHPEVAHFVRVLERCGWVYESPAFLWGPWLRTPEARRLISGESLAEATPEQLARLMTAFARQERIVEGSRLEFYHSGVLLGALTRVQALLDEQGSPAVPQPAIREEATQEGPSTAVIPAAPEAEVAPQVATPAPSPTPEASPSALTFEAASARVHAFISQFEEGYFPPLLMLARLTEEVGEIARVLAHQNGKTPKPGEDAGDLEMELADLLFVTLCLSNERGLSLERGFTRMMDKVERRDAERWTKKKEAAGEDPPGHPTLIPPRPKPGGRSQKTSSRKGGGSA
ncbi:NTP pyrophosphatase, house-cleaning of non-canonical NTPs [Deinococcus reticulitermitis]|uniref:NTP pyrophosphatase, house-cleaning of non-canonical NTPs n=1 Tax=Deinococcus reticulitermitis TaxID=856736 RepID=A0A1H7CEV7_9DEIO|nr:NTP pyrophosphatase, house-cleaning of non-canonical NTPs [Deinococcus reticulitermitis]